VFPEHAYLIRWLITIVGAVLLWCLKILVLPLLPPSIVREVGHFNLLVGLFSIPLVFLIVLYLVLTDPSVWYRFLTF
jgi:hypothetical protein